jgi:hypothetical protein
MIAIATRCKKAGLLGLFLWLAAVLSAPAWAQAPSAQAPSLLEQLEKGFPPSSPQRKSLMPPLRVEVQQAQGSFDARTNEPIVVINMSPRSGRMFQELTQNNIGRRLVLRIDGKIVAEPIIREPILGGVVQISGGFTVKDAAELAERLSRGEAKVEVELVAD